GDHARFPRAAQGARSAPAARPVRRRRRLAGAHRRGHAPRGRRHVDGHRRRPGRHPEDLAAARAAGAAAVGVRRRHPLRDHLVEARHQLQRDLARHAVRRGRGAAGGEVHRRDVHHRLHHQPPDRGRHRRQGLAGVGARGQAADPGARRPGAHARAAP
ncbi:MAG: Sulfite oxidase and related enzymes, partial [uncultured Actinomycetospora sp.]